MFDRNFASAVLCNQLDSNVPQTLSPVSELVKRIDLPRGKRLNLQTFFVKHEIEYLRNLTTYDTIEIIFKNRIFDQSLTVVELLTMSSHLYLHR